MKQVLCGGEAHVTVRVHGDPVGLAFQEVPRALDPPELGLGGPDRGRGQEDGGEHVGTTGHGASEGEEERRKGPPQRSTARERSREPLTA